jgi:hypothetical protein
MVDNYQFVTQLQQVKKEQKKEKHRIKRTFKFETKTPK